MKITNVKITPIAFRDAPIINVKGVHEPYGLRTIIELETDEGHIGLGETYGNSKMLNYLRLAAEKLEGLDPFHLNDLANRISEGLQSVEPDTDKRPLMVHDGEALAFSAFEVACMDLQGKHLGLSLVDLLGGAVRGRVPFSAYLFYKMKEHVDHLYEPDRWGEVLTPDTLVEEARDFVGTYGFGALKLKGGVLEPELEIESMRKLGEAFPGLPLRIDPNGGWTVETTVKVAKQLGGILEYLEDPVVGMDNMAAVANQIDIPLATNLVVTSFDHLPKAIRTNAVQIVLSDHHYWGGLSRSKYLAAICKTWGLGLSMHSNSHMGITLAAMTHLAASTPNLTYSCDTHYPWQEDEVIAGGKLHIADGSLTPPLGPGLGVSLDYDELARLHALYNATDIRDRDDTGYMLRYDPGYVRQVPRY